MEQSFFDWLTLAIAVWGAILSTVVYIQKKTKEQRKIKVIIEEQLFQGRHLFIITNTGFRPITIQDIHVFVEDKHGDLSRDTPWDNAQSPCFPFTIDDGESKTFLLTEYMTGFIRDKKYHLKISVTDGEGNIYRKYSEAQHNEKYHWHAKKDKTPAFIVNKKFAVRRFFSRFRHE